MQTKYPTNLLRDWQSFSGEPTAATIGNFDGLHLGHQALINKVHALCDEYQLASMLITFEPLPKQFFLRQPSMRIMRFRDKFRQLQRLQMQWVVALRFNQALSSMKATAFIEQCLIHGLSIRQLVVGEDFRFGAQQEGNVALLQSYQSDSFRVHVVPNVCSHEQRISSSHIRNALIQGRLSDVQQQLGRPFTLEGIVSRGQGIGHQLGAPTANISVPPDFVVPLGVYLTQNYGIFGSHLAVTNVGVRPTVGGVQRVVESHLIGYSGNLYGQRMQCTFIKKLRTEKKFSHLDDLAKQIQIDILEAKAQASKVSI